MNNPNVRIFTQNGRNGLDIYIDISGKIHYLASRRRSGLVYQMLKDGMTVGELNRIKPSGSRPGQKKYHYVQHLLRILEDFFQYDLAA